MPHNTGIVLEHHFMKEYLPLFYIIPMYNLDLKSTNWVCFFIKLLAESYVQMIKRLVQTKRILTTPVCRIVVISTDNESQLIYHLTDFVVRMHKAELVWCMFEIDVSGLVTSQVEDRIFRLTLKSMGKNRQLFKKRLFHKVIPISIFLNSRNHNKKGR